jgi:hypothetical protein
VSGIPDRGAVLWFDKWGDLLTDKISSLNGDSVAVGASPDGDFVVAQSESFLTDGIETVAFIAQRYTLRPPSVLEVQVGPASTNLIVAFSQEMATDGAGSVLETANWALRLADGRYLIQDDSSDSGPLATAEQFGNITFGFNALTNRWEATLPLEFTPIPGTYKLIARRSLQDVSGRFLSDDSSNGSEVFSFTFTIPIGDYDRNGVVELADGEHWSRHFGETSESVLNADGTNDGTIDASDYVVWRKFTSRALPQLVLTQGDYDGNGAAQSNGYVAWESGFGKTSTSETDANLNNDGIVDAADYTILRKNLLAVTAGKSDPVEPVQISSHKARQHAVVVAAVSNPSPHIGISAALHSISMDRTEIMPDSQQLAPPVVDPRSEHTHGRLWHLERESRTARLFRNAVDNWKSTTRVDHGLLLALVEDRMIWRSKREGSESDVQASVRNRYGRSFEAADAAMALLEEDDIDCRFPWLG